MIETPFTINCAFSSKPERFAGHFIHQVVIPGAALVDRIIKEIERFTGRQVIALHQVKFIAAAPPPSQFLLSGIAGQSLARFELHCQTQLICSGTVALGSVD
jgi:3-hydroxymyristoyl/3-hydroxydecanoyl-(acyl carrier protein) dehydratase